jgi:ubiquinone/menaquinone biosynthesis C-methylase UbiE
MTELHQSLASYARHPWHARVLRYAYASSHALLRATGADPLARARPRVLLCGTGSLETSATFLEFVLGRAPCAQVTVVDLAEAPLRASAAHLANQVELVRADARHLPFSAATFDLVESDFFLQYFNLAGKRAVLGEWRRILAPGGALMTRDYVRIRWRDRLPDALRRATLARTLRVQLNSIDAAALSAAYAEAGLNLSRSPIRWQGIALPLVCQMVARPM